MDSMWIRYYNQLLPKVHHVYKASPMKQKKIWITWETQRRNITLSKALGAKLYQYDLNMHRLVRYPLLTLLTLWTVLWQRPQILFVQNPSMLLAFLAVNMGRVFPMKVIVDAHNAGVSLFDGQRRWVTRIFEYLFRHADYTIVTNESLKPYVGHFGKAEILPDPIPDLKKEMSPLTEKQFSVLFICTWAADEPYLEVIKAAESLQDKAIIYITGRSKGKENSYGKPLPSNVRMTGFISEEEFVGKLNATDAIMDLTTREDCLVCGAYEAVSVEKPLIISDTKALRHYFSKGCIYTKNNAESIQSSIIKAMEGAAELTKDMREFKQSKKIEWNKMKNSFLDCIEKNCR